MNYAIRMLSVAIVLELIVATWFLTSTPQTNGFPQLQLDGYPACTQNFIGNLIQKARADVGYDWYHVADAIFAAGFYAEAEACYQYAVELEPGRTEWRYGWAFCLYTLGELRDADKQFQECIVRGHSEPESCNWFIGMSALRDSRTEDAAAAFQASSALGASQLELAEIALGSDDIETAELLLHPLADKHPDVWRIHHLLARAASEKGDHAAAREYEAMAEVVRNVIPNPWSKRGLIIQTMSAGLSVQNQAGQAMQQLTGHTSTARISEDIGRDNSVLWEPLLEDVLSEVDCRQGNFDSQIQRLERIIERDGVDTYRAARLGTAYAAQGRTESAMRMFELGIKIRTGNQAAEMIAIAHTLTEMLRKAGKTREADAVHALAEFETGCQLVDELRVPEAASAFQLSVELDPASPSSWYWLGRTRQMLTEDDAAVAAYDECLSISPDHERAARHRNALLSRLDSGESDSSQP